MNYKEHAMREFKAAGWILEDGQYCDDMQELICTQVLQLLDMFSDHGHSGSSAPYARNMFHALSAFEPLVPLTGEDWEWLEVSEGIYQNIRCGSVFKDEENGAYSIDGIIFREPDGCCHTSGKSRVPVTFPYTPISLYQDIIAAEEEGA